MCQKVLNKTVTYAVKIPIACLDIQNEVVEKLNTHQNMIDMLENDIRGIEELMKETIVQFIN